MRVISGAPKGGNMASGDRWRLLNVLPRFLVLVGSGEWGEEEVLAFHIGKLLGVWRGSFRVGRPGGFGHGLLFIDSLDDLLGEVGGITNVENNGHF